MIETSPSSLSYPATNCGTFSVLVSSYYSGNTGTYGLAVNGLSDSLRLCLPVISGPRLTLNGIGGNPGATFILYSEMNVAVPFNLWSPILTNQYDPLGVLTYTNSYNPTSRQLYFRSVELN